MKNKITYLLSKNCNILLLIIFSFITGYLLKIVALPYTYYKIFILILFSIFLFVYFTYVTLRNYTLLLLSVIICIIECNVTTSVPFVIHLSEAGIKILSPIVIQFIIQHNKKPKLLIKTGICLTFIAHGLLALNIIPTPPTFYQMTGKILSLNFEQSILFLDTFGILDILACFIILFSKQRIYTFAVIYCIIWGGITALARTLYLLDSDFKTILFSGIAETMVRIPNSLMPLLLIYGINKKKAS
jgi:hypothetical protein